MVRVLSLDRNRDCCYLVFKEHFPTKFSGFSTISWIKKEPRLLVSFEPKFGLTVGDKLFSC